MADDSAIRAFLAVQTTRAQLYTRFQQGFQAFLQTRREASYRALMAELTTAFSDCSRAVMGLESSLRDAGRPDLAARLREVQEAERAKLRLTLSLQALRQAAAFRTLPWLQSGGGSGGGAADAAGGGGGDAGDVDDDEALALLDPHFAAVRRRGPQHAHAHAHGSGHAHPHAHRHGQAEAEAQGQDAGRGAARAGSGDDAGDGAGAGGGRGCGREAVAPAHAHANGHTANGHGHKANGHAEATALPDSPPASEAGAAGGGGNSGGGGGACGGGGEAAGPPLPTRREYEAAVAEATRELDACIRTINEVIGDLRMELEE